MVYLTLKSYSAILNQEKKELPTIYKEIYYLLVIESVYTNPTLQSTLYSDEESPLTTMGK